MPAKKTRTYTIREDPYLSCRRGGPGHDWDHLSVAKKSAWGFPVDYRCPKCKSVRHDVYDANGDLSFRTYSRPDDWKDTERQWTTGEIRLEMIRRNRALKVVEAPRRKAS